MRTSPPCVSASGAIRFAVTASRRAKAPVIARQFVEVSADIGHAAVRHDHTDPAVSQDAECCLCRRIRRIDTRNARGCTRTTAAARQFEDENGCPKEADPCTAHGCVPVVSAPWRI